MTLYAFDGASMFDLAVAKAHGAIAASAYIVGSPGGMPHATKARIDAILAAGLGAYANWERAPDFFQTCTLAEAEAAGAEGSAYAIACGFEAGAGYDVGFSFDFDCPAGLFPVMAAKIARVNIGLAGRHHFGMYGQQSLIDWLAGKGFIDGKHWLMMSTFGQPYSPTDPRVCMVQGHDLAGNWIQGQAIPGTDINTVTDPHALRAKWPPGSPYAQGEDMTPAESAMLKDLHDRIGKIDIEAYQMSVQAVPAIAAIRTMVNDIPNALNAAVAKITAALANTGVTLTPDQVTALAAAVSSAAPKAFTVDTTSHVSPA